MIRSITLLSLIVFSMFSAKAGFVPVTVTGFNKDVVANGTGPVRSSTTTSVDDIRDTSGYTFNTQDYRSPTSVAPTYFLPQNGLINSAATAGLTYQLASYSGNNTLKLSLSGESGVLTFGTQYTASDVYVLATSGAAATTTTFTVKFTDSTSETFSRSVSDWYNGTVVAVQGFGRVSLADGAVDNAGTSLNPRLYEFRLTLASANWSKPVAYISAAKTSTAASFLQVMAVAVNTVSPCGPPVSQPTNLVLMPTVYGVSGSFTASVPPANKYMVLRCAGTGGPDTPPTDGVVYTAGQVLGNSTVISVSALTTFTDPGLTIGATYTYAVLGYSDSTCYGISPAYNIVNPLINFATIPSCSATPTGTYTVGPTGTYPTLTAAMTALNNSAGAAGNIIIELQPAYTSASETFPIVIPNISTSPCAVGNPTLIIRPAAGATGLVITGSNATAILDFNNAQRATLDGRPGGTGTAIQLSVINISTAGVAIRLFNDASFNTITYCDVQGQNTANLSSALSGVIYIGQANATTLRGNDYNTISFNNIHGTVTGTPAIGISAYGTTPVRTRYNDSCTIANNRIYDYFLATSASTGVKLDVGNNAWTINSNSLYQTAARTYTTSATHRGLWITPNVAANDTTASNFLITNNFIGGSGTAAGGTAYTMGGTVANVFFGMDLSVGSGLITSVQNNVVANIALTSSSTSTTGVFAGIVTANGNINMGNLVGNTIGSATVPGSINVISASGGTSFGVRVATGATINVTGNTITGITGSGTSGTVSTNFTGIGVAGGATINLANNTIGSATVANSISLAASSSATAQSLNGISITLGTTTFVTNNLIANLTNGYTGTGAGTTRGISVSSSASTITSNTIRNLSSATTSTSGGATSALIGIAMTSTSTSGCNITGNTIHSLISTSTSTTAALNFTGLFYSGTSSATSYITKNNIHSFDAAVADSNITFTGIDFATATAVVANNFIRLGIKPDGTSFSTATLIRGISSNSSSLFNGFIYNSIYVGGTAVSGPSLKNSYAFIRTAASGTYDIRNNIFVNSRSNAGAGGKHYATYYTTATTGATPNYNVYFANGTGGVFAFNGTADVATYTSGWLAGDANSAYGSPGFVNATGTAATVDLHINAATPSIAESAGTPNAFIFDDYDGTARSTTTPDIGADEFIGVNPNLCTGTPVSGTVTASSSPVCPGNSFTLSVSGSTNAPGISFQWQSSPDSTNWTNISAATNSTVTINQTVATFYRVVVTCSNSSLFANSAGLRVGIVAPVYAVYNGLLYTESFEAWTNSCSTTDLPGTSWTNTPSTGNNSWRRHDQGTSAGWTSTNGAYTPVSTTGAFSARFHSFNSPAGTQGTLDFYVNMSAASASTNIRFDYINTTGNDSLVVFISTNGGTTFTRLDSIRLRAAWATKTINITSASATTVIRLQATADFGGTDIGVDNFQLVNFEQCTGTPTAGTITPATLAVCPGVSYTLTANSATTGAGITYQWQSSPDCTTWTNVTGATTTVLTNSQTAATSYRLVVTCGPSGLTASSACITVSMSAPTTCYCTPTYTLGGTTDYVTTLTLRNLTQATPGNVTPYYINYTSTQTVIPTLERAATYPLTLTFSTDGNQYSGVWIDFNQDGTFATTEYFSTGTNAGASGISIISILVPANAVIGQTRMRVRGGEDVALTSAQACGASSNSYGQAQDYLVTIIDQVFPVTLLRFTGERKSNANLLTWETASELNNKGFDLQRSADGVQFNSIGFVNSKAVNGNSNANLAYTFTDSKALVSNNYYRLKQMDKDGKATYSHIVLLKGNKPTALTLSVVYPNPVISKLNVIIASPKAEMLTLIVSDVTGKIVYQQKVAAMGGDNKYEVNVRMLTSGNYVIKALCNDGCETVVSRFVKQ